MKKLLKFLPLFVVAIMSMAFWSCSDDDDDKVITNTELPTEAKTFLSTYYTDIKYQAKEDKGEYEVYLANGHRVDFYKDGTWKDVDAKFGETVPSGFYPSEIDTYIAANYPDNGINEISKESYGYDVELVKNGIDLEFDNDGVFLRIDK